MIKENYLGQRMFDISKKMEIIEIILITLSICLVPIFVPYLLNEIFGSNSAIAMNSQFIVGTIVNVSIIITGINIKGWKKLIGIVTLPSINAVMSGLVFQTASIYTVYMIPFIWLGNMTIIFLYKYLFIIKKNNYIFTSFIGIFAKVAIIFLGFNLLTIITAIDRQSKIGQILTMAMGVNQLITAAIGSLIAFVILKGIYKKGN